MEANARGIRQEQSLPILFTLEGARILRNSKPMRAGLTARGRFRRQQVALRVDQASRGANQRSDSTSYVTQIRDNKAMNCHVLIRI